MHKTLKKILLVAAMVTLVGGTFTGIMTYSNIGFSDDFSRQWTFSFMQAVCVIFPMGVLIMWTMHKVVEAFFGRLSSLHKNLIFGFGMALSMEAVMALSTTYRNIGLGDWQQFSQAFLASYLMVLPVALVLSPIMTLLIKPKMEAFLAS
ncbi:hypothetical protein Patl_0285 [Paraglaciecola sp. T6c]|uniref:DUF2798 domain-containing protein n=1 Tax=Pseudoalteromonas atlantica (strain T6c / ATCC BAA-1087) TaxID=3042615 RepID=UPI00005C7194|nr:DUF2798 domain-containing protein [Paraglaciecola sp. T6c]ABG38817.1 hypothetical protein Patl_0285 [Paraglaciecola sp. T6c]